MKLVLSLSFVFLLVSSCKKEATDYDQIVGKWVWTKTTSHYSNNSSGIAEPSPSFRDSQYLVFNADKTFSINKNGLPMFHRPVPLSGIFEITSPTADDYRKVLVLNGPDFQESFKLTNDGSNITLTENLDSSTHLHEYKKR